MRGKYELMCDWRESAMDEHASEVLGATLKTQSGAMRHGLLSCHLLQPFSSSKQCNSHTHVLGCSIIKGYAARDKIESSRGRQGNYESN